MRVPNAADDSTGVSEKGLPFFIPFSFSYGDFAMRSSTKIGSRTWASYSHSADGNRYLTSLDYGNGDSVDYSYDKIGN